MNFETSKLTGLRYLNLSNVDYILKIKKERHMKLKNELQEYISYGKTPPCLGREINKILAREKGVSKREIVERLFEIANKEIESVELLEQLNSDVGPFTKIIRMKRIFINLFL